MRLILNFKNLEQEEFIVSINNKKFKVVSVDNVLTVDYLDKGSYEISIVQNNCSSSSKILSWIIWGLTFFIRGIFNALILNAEAKWYKEISPYFISTTFNVDIEEDTEMTFFIKYKKYDEWLQPTFTCKEKPNIDVVYKLNTDEFLNGYNRFVKNVLSVELLLFIFLLYMLIIFIKVVNIAGIICCGVLLIGLIVLSVCLIKKQHNVLNKILEKAIKSEDCND